MKKKCFIIVIALMITLMSGCSLITSIDNLLSPPKLSVEQEEIYNALTNTTGESINLKYPKSGKYLSAFIIEDIDGDGGDEAIVFYEKQGLTVDENTLRINILDQFNDGWQSVCDTSAEGSDIEKIIISKLGDNDRINFIIGSSISNNAEKSVAIYTYQDGMIEKTFSTLYSLMEVTDVDSDGLNDILIISSGTPSILARAAIYKLDSEGTYYEYKTELNGSFTDFERLVYGDIGDGKICIYIDAVSGSGQIQTDIIYMENNTLINVLTPEESNATTRPLGLNTMDIDKDGIFEIPIQTKFIGYEKVPEGEQIKMTEWYYYNGNKRVKKYSSYHSVTDGYTFILPDRWLGNVSVVRDIINEELVFCKYNVTSGNGEELLRIFVSDDSVEINDRILSGYQIIHKKGEKSYMAYISDIDEKDELKFLTGELSLCFKFTE